MFGSANESVNDGAVFGADEEPVLSPARLLSQVALGDVVGHRQAAIVEETLERLLLIERLADSARPLSWLVAREP